MIESHYFETGPVGTSDAAQRAALVEINGEILEFHLAALPELRAQWLALCGAARQRLARCPFLLVDAGFAHTQLWSSVALGGVHERVRPRTLPTSHGALSAALLRRILMLAWYMARSNPAAARAVLGMTASCAGVLAACRLVDLELVADRRPEWIRPRWERQSQVWQSWLSVAARDSPRELERLQLWGLQSLAAEVRRRAE